MSDDERMVFCELWDLLAHVKGKQNEEWRLKVAAVRRRYESLDDRPTLPAGFFARPPFR